MNYQIRDLDYAYQVFSDQESNSDDLFAILSNMHHGCHIIDICIEFIFKPRVPTDFNCIFDFSIVSKFVTRNTLSIIPHPSCACFNCLPLGVLCVTTKAKTTHCILDLKTFKILLNIPSDRGCVILPSGLCIPNLLTNYRMKLHEIKTMCTNISPEHTCLIFVESL